MARPEKMEAVEEFKANIQGNSISIVTQYQGITVAEVTDLRSKLRAQKVTFKVYKNTLARRGLDELGLTDVMAFMEGPTAWAFCEDPVAPAKVLKEFSKDVDKVAMRGGILDGKPVSGIQLEALASLPPRDQLLAQVAGTMAAPIRKMLGTLEALPRNLVNVLDQVRKQKEEGGEAA